MKGRARSKYSHTSARREDEGSFIPRGRAASLFDSRGVQRLKGRGQRAPGCSLWAEILRVLGSEVTAGMPGKREVVSRGQRCGLHLLFLDEQVGVKGGPGA